MRFAEWKAGRRACNRASVALPPGTRGIVRHRPLFEAARSLT